MSAFNQELLKLSEAMEQQGLEFGTGFNKVLSYYRHKILSHFITRHENDRVLEVGGATGLGTSYLSSRFNSLEVLEPVPKYAEALDKKFDNAKVYCRTLEDHWGRVNGRKYDWIIAFNVLEHVQKASEFLSAAFNLLDHNGRLIITVPNSNSLHRQLGLKMGLISDLRELTKSDISIGHKRSYNDDTIKDSLYNAGFMMFFTIGNFIKPFPNSVMEKVDEKCYEGLHRLAGQYKEISAELFVLAIKKGEAL